MMDLRRLFLILFLLPGPTTTTHGVDDVSFLHKRHALCALGRPGTCRLLLQLNPLQGCCIQLCQVDLSRLLLLLVLLLLLLLLLLLRLKPLDDWDRP